MPTPSTQVIRLLTITLLWLALAIPAAAQKTTAQIQAEINSVFVTGCSGCITASNVSGVLTDIIHSYLNVAPNPGNLYVATTGSDASTTCSSPSPCLTLQHALTVAYTTYNLQGSDLTINIGAGSFTGGQINGRPPNSGNGGRITILGAGSTATTITTSIIAAFGADIKLGSMKITAPAIDVLVEFSSRVTLADSDLNLGATSTALIDVYEHSSFLGNSSFGLTLSGGAQYGFLISSSSNVTLSVAGVITITNTPNFSIAFVDAIDNSLFDPGTNASFSGTATGTSYALGTNSVIDMENLTTALPGTGYGTIATNSSFYQTTVLAAGNTVYGYNTGQAITTGVNNTAFGYSSLAALVTNAASTGATAVGSNSLNNTTVLNDAFGYKAGNSLTTSPNNTAIGAFAIGAGTTITGSGKNTAVGYTAMQFLDSTANTNTAIGAQALSGSSGTHVTGNTNTVLGYNAANALSTGSNNILLGANSALNAATDSSSITIGTSATGLGSNTINLGGIYQATGTGTPSTSAASVPGGFTATGKVGVGYSTGAGSTVTQGTSRTTGVTINAPTGAITLFSAAGSATAATFTVTNSSVAATDTIIVNQKSGTNLYETFITAVAAGSFNITFFTTGGTATDAPVFNFAVLKGSAT